MAIHSRVRLVKMTVAALVALALSGPLTCFVPEKLEGGNRPARADRQQITDSITSSQSTLLLEQRADIAMARKSYADAADYYYRALKQSLLSTRDQASIWNK